MPCAQSGHLGGAGEFDVPPQPVRFYSERTGVLCTVYLCGPSNLRKYATILLCLKISPLIAVYTAQCFAGDLCRCTNIRQRLAIAVRSSRHVLPLNWLTMSSKTLVSSVALGSCTESCVVVVYSCMAHSEVRQPSNSNMQQLASSVVPRLLFVRQRISIP